MTTETGVVEQPTAEQQAVAQQEAEAGFSKGFEKVSGKPAEDATTSDQDAERKTEEAATEAAAKADAQAKADAEAKAQAERERLLADLPKRLSTIEGHIGGIKSKLDTAVLTAKAAKDAGKAAPTQAEIADASTSTEKWKKLESDFPEFAAAFAERQEAASAELLKKIPKIDVDGIKKEVGQSISEGIDEAEERAFLRLKHPTWKATIAAPEFAEWLKAQPEDKQKLADSKIADDAIALLDAYAEHRKAAEAAEQQRLKKQKRLEGAVTPTGTSAPQTTGISDEDAFARGFKRVAKHR